MDATRSKQDRWFLANAATYLDRAGAGCFGSVPDIVATHSFGWDRGKGCLYVEDRYGIGGTFTRRAHMPVELVESFLMSCLYPDFRHTFLEEVYEAKEPASEVLRACGYVLEVSRGVAKPMSVASGRYWLPSLSMICTDSQGKTESLALFCEFRNAFGRYMKGLRPAELRKNLRTDK